MLKQYIVYYNRYIGDLSIKNISMKHCFEFLNKSHLIPSHNNILPFSSRLFLESTVKHTPGLDTFLFVPSQHRLHQYHSSSFPLGQHNEYNLKVNWPNTRAHF